MNMTRTMLAAMLVLFLSACGEGKPVVVASKQSPENRVVAEMVATLAEQAGIPVERYFGVPSSGGILASMRRGEVSVYPEYTGTGLAMLGLAVDAKDDRALELVRREFAALNLSWSEPLGFDNDYALVMLGDEARALGITSYSDLAERSGRLTIGFDEDFRGRPVDGFKPLVRRYGMRFAGVKSVAPGERFQLYDQLIEKRVDVAVVHLTDGQIAAFDLRILRDDLNFFPRYRAALLMRDAALRAHPSLQEAISRLEGRLDLETMRGLSDRVSLRGEDPRRVARDALLAMGLIEGSTAATAARASLTLAISSSASADGETAAVLRALQRSYSGSSIRFQSFSDPLAAIDNGSARVALVGAPAFFAPGAVDPAIGQPPVREGVEAVALAGTSYMHLFALSQDLSSVSAARRIATPPVGSTGFRTAQSLVDALDLEATLLPVEADDPESLADALVESGADAALLMQPLKNWAALALFERGYRLLPLVGWDSGRNRLTLPYLQQARLTPADYPALTEPVETLVAQLVLAGPAPPADGMGDQGPAASFSSRALPVSERSVIALNRLIGESGQINPIIPQSRALEPRLPSLAAPVNPSPAFSLLTIVVLAMLIWMASLLLRPQVPPDS